MDSFFAALAGLGLIQWLIIGAALGFAAAALASLWLNHRIAPALLLLACVAALGLSRWADAPGHAQLQAQAFFVGCALLGAVSGSVGWLIFTRRLWAMIASAVTSAAMVVAMPLVAPFLAHLVGI